jgi:hypothetical protein
MLMAAVLAAGVAGVEGGSGPTMVQFADGSRVHLVSWVLSYEFLSGKPGALPSEVMRREVRELRLGGKSWSAAGTRLELEYQPIERERDGENGEVVKEKVLRVVSVTVTREGKSSKVRPQAPDRKFLLGDEKSLNVLPRTLDLRGETLTGTKREVCLMSFSDLADCGGTEDARVVKVEFP